MPNPKIISLSFSNPPYCYSQRQIFDSLGYNGHFWRIFEDSKIDKRYFSVPLETLKLLSFQQQQDLYAEWACELSKRAMKEALMNSVLDNIGLLSYSSCTGFLPGPTAGHYLAKEFGLKDVEICNLASLGCESSFPGLRRCFDYTKVTGKTSVAISCVPSGYDVITKNAFVDISKISVGDSVLGDNGKFCKVTAIMDRQYEGNIISIKSHCLPEISLTPEHPCLIYRYIGSNFRTQFESGRSTPTPKQRTDKRSWELKYTPSREVRRGDYLLLPIPKFPEIKSLKVTNFMDIPEENGKVYTTQRTNSTKHPSSRRAVCTHVPNELLTEDFIRLCGLYIAEGDNGGGRGINLSFGADEPDLIEESVKLWATLGFKAKTQPNKGKSIRVRINSRILAKLFNDWFGHGAKNKHLPYWAFQLPVGMKQILVDYMWRGDGWKRPHVVAYLTSSRELAQGLLLLLAMLGTPASWRSFRNLGFSRNIFHTISIHYGKQNKRQWHIDNKWREQTRYLWFPVKEIIEKPFNGRVYNLGTESHSYVCNMATLHNCELSSLSYYPETIQESAENDYETLRAAAIFGDGCSCAVVGFDDNPRHPEILDFASVLDTRFIDRLGYTWRNGRLRVRLSKDVPQIAVNLAGRSIIKLLDQNDLGIPDIKYWIIHPPGSVVLDNLRDTLHIPEEKLKYSRKVLQYYGNCSSATVGIVGSLLMQSEPNPKGYGIMVNVGPGMAGNSVLLRFQD